MNPVKFETGSVHYIHLADPSEEVIVNTDQAKLSTQYNEHDPLANKLILMASRGMITSEEYEQLAVYVTDR